MCTLEESSWWPSVLRSERLRLSLFFWLLPFDCFVVIENGTGDLMKAVTDLVFAISFSVHFFCPFLLSVSGEGAGGN